MINTQRNPPANVCSRALIAETSMRLGTELGQVCQDIILDAIYLSNASAGGHPRVEGATCL